MARIGGRLAPRASRKAERERASLADGALDGDRAVMGVDDGLGDSEAEPDSASILVVRLPKLLEHMRQSIRRDLVARVANSKHYCPTLDATLEHDPATFGSELHRVTQQVAQHLLHARPVDAQTLITVRHTCLQLDAVVRRDWPGHLRRLVDDRAE